METQAELSVNVGHTATGTVTLAGSVRNEHRGTYKRLLGVIVQYHTRHCEQLLVLLLLFVRFNYNQVLPLVTYNHILVTDEVAQHLVQRFVLNDKTCRLVYVPQRDLLQ